MKNLGYIPLILFAFLIVQSCSEKNYFTNSLDLEDGVWSDSEVFSNEFSITDTTDRFNLFLDIEHSTDFFYENVYINISTEFPDKKPGLQSLPINLADNRGNWFGDCSSTTCDLRVVLKQNIRFQALGDYTISFTQNSRQPNLKGINSLVFTIVESNPK